MTDQLDPKAADKRTWQRYVALGQLDEKAYERFVKGLPDAAEKAAPVETVMFESEDEADDADA